MPKSAKTTSAKKKSGAKKKTVTPEQRMKRLVTAVSKRLKDLRARKDSVKKFEDEVVPKFKSWVDETFAEEKAQALALENEVDMLEEAYRNLRMAEIYGQPIPGGNVESMLDQLAEQWADQEIDDEDDTADEAGPPNLDDIPDFVIDEMFEEMMYSSRGIDVDEMSPKDYKKARQQFEDSLKHAQTGDKSAFEKALLQVGADHSDKNVSAVKKAFRRLAKRLHPDRNPDFGEEAQELWNELKMSKEALDLESIERIELQWRLLQKDEFSPEEEVKIKDFREELNDEFADLRFTVQRYKNHPMWGVENEEPSDELKAEIADELQDSIEELTGIKEELLGLVEEFKKKAKKKATAKKKSPKAKKKTAAKKKSPKPKAKKKAAKSKPEPESDDTEQMFFDFD